MRYVIDLLAVSHPVRTYDVLKPIIQTKDEGKVAEQDCNPSAETKRRYATNVDRGRPKGGDSESSLQAYAKHLLDTLDSITSSSVNGQIPSPRQAPLSPSRVGSRSRALPPSLNVPEPSPPISPASRSTDRLDIPMPGKLGKGFRGRKGSFVNGDDELVEEGGDEGGCGEAVQVLSRHSAKSEPCSLPHILQVNIPY